ncbi:aconitase X swivel domain-containing protein [Gemmobacter lanyuensis]
MDKIVVPAEVGGKILVCDEGLSVWGGVDAQTGTIIDALHPQHGASLSGRVVMMPTSRGSCTGSGVLLGLALAGTAPAALIFREEENILTLGALIASRMFDRQIAVLRLSAESYAALSRQDTASLTGAELIAGDLRLP